MDPDDDTGDALEAAGVPVVEPEVLDSLDDADRTRYAPPPRQLGCTLGPGCGCLGLPLAAAAGILLSPLLALLWILSLGRVPFSLAKLMQQARRGPSRR